MENVLYKPFLHVICTLIPIFSKFGSFFNFLKQLFPMAGLTVVQRNMPTWQAGIFNYISDRMSASWTL